MCPQAGADVNSANPDTPLVVATEYGLADCIKYLLEAGANPNISDKQVSFWSSIFFPLSYRGGKARAYGILVVHGMHALSCGLVLHVYVCIFLYFVHTCWVYAKLFVFMILYCYYISIFFVR
jgi:hypothetical protein